MGELDHSFTHLVCRWLSQHPVTTVACWWDIASPCPSKSPFIFTNDFRGKSLVSELGKQLLSDKLQACRGTAGPADNATDCLLWIALCCVHWCFWSSPFLPALPGMDAQSSATLRQAPRPICAQHILLSCHSAVCPPCNVTEQNILCVMAQQALCGLYLWHHWDHYEGCAQQGQGNFFLKEILAPRRSLWHKDASGEGSNKTQLC